MSVFREHVSASCIICQHHLHNNSSEGMKNLLALWKTALKRNPGGALKFFLTAFFLSCLNNMFTVAKIGN